MFIATQICFSLILSVIVFVILTTQVLERYGPLVYLEHQPVVMLLMPTLHQHRTIPHTEGCLPVSSNISHYKPKDNMKWSGVMANHCPGRRYRPDQDNRE